MTEQPAADDDVTPFTDPKGRGNFRFHYTVWRVTGIWLRDSDPLVLRLIAYAVQLISLFTFNFLMLLSLGTARTMDETIETLLPSTTTVVLSIKAVLLMRQRSLLMQLFALIGRLEASVRGNAVEEMYLRRQRRNYLRLLVCMTCGCFGSILWVFGQAVLSSRRRLMWRSWFPFDWMGAESPQLHRWAVGFQIVCNLHIGLLYASMDTFGPLMFGTLSAFLDVLADRLRRLGTGAKAGGEANVRELIACVRYHNTCLQFQNGLHELFGVHYTVQFVASGLVLCVTAFMLSIGRPDDDPAKFAFLVSYILNMGLALFIPCYFGSMVRAKSDELSMAAFQCGWPLMRQTVGGGGFHRVLLMFMQAAQRPIVQYTWKKVFTIALPTFVTVCRAAYSLLSCLKGS